MWDNEENRGARAKRKGNAISYGLNGSYSAIMPDLTHATIHVVGRVYSIILQEEEIMRVVCLKRSYDDGFTKNNFGNNISNKPQEKSYCSQYNRKNHTIHNFIYLVFPLDTNFTRKTRNKDAIESSANHS